MPRTTPSTSYKLATSLFLVAQTISTTAPTKKVEPPTDHILVLDVSYSMCGDLPQIREQIKKKLPKMVKADDTVSIIWFSSRGEFGVLLEGEPVASLTDLKAVNAAIDRWIRPVGATGFKEPLEEVSKLAGKLAAKRKDSVRSLFFMSDGCDNQWGRAEILKAVEKAGGAVAAATFVEYGYYADRNLLSSMAEKCGGSLIHADTFDKYEPIFEAAMQRRPIGAKRVEVAIAGDPIGGFAYALSDGEILTYAVENGKVSVPEGLQQVFYLSPSSVGADAGPNGPVTLTHVASLYAPATKKEEHAGLQAAYAALSVFAVRMKPDVVYPILKSLGDVAFIEQFSTCFGKQKYSAFQDATKAAAFDPTRRFTKGYDPNKVPRDDAFTVLDLLRVLSSSDDNRVLLDSPSFRYSPIGRGRVDSSEQLTADELEEIQNLTAQLSGEKDVKKIKTINERIASITSAKKEALKFVADAAPEGYAITSLTFNEERPNVSFLVRKEGTVDLSSRLPAEFAGKGVGKIPPTFRTHIWRNYNVIKDGLVNVDVLPVRISVETYNQLRAEGAVASDSSDVVSQNEDASIDVNISLRALPVINRKMVKATSAKTLFEKEFALCQARAAQKVYNGVKKEKFPAKSAVLSALYGDAGATWLKEQGFTDGGFNPKGTQAESTDFYMGKELHVLLKGLSTIPSLNECRKQIEKGKTNAGASLMVPHVNAVDAFLKSDVYKNASDQDKLFETWLDGQAKAATNRCRELLIEIAQIKFSIVVGQVWFTEFPTIDDNKLTIKVDGKDVEGTVTMKEIEVKI